MLNWLRARLDGTTRDRVLLAEANMWPADVRPYFGDGDEFHMAFHFPLMPRMFMAVSSKTENRSSNPRTNARRFRETASGDSS